MRVRSGFTLVELLVVVLIIGLVSVVALPTVLPALNSRQVSEAGRILQGVIVGCRDRAIHDGRPSGFRLLPDPAFFQGSQTYTDAAGNTIVVPDLLRLPGGTIDPSATLAYNRVVPIEPAPEYREGFATVRPSASYADVVTDPTGKGTYAWPTLVLEEAPVDKDGAPNPPTSWMWNIRVGDRIQLNDAGPWYVVVGPMVVGPAAGNSEMFVNVGQPGATSPLGPAGVAIDYLLLVNGRDDNGNGVADEGWDGVDNNGVAGVDEHRPDVTLPIPPPSPGGPTSTVADEWEVETWEGAAAAGMLSVPYTIRRRPLPAPGAREVALPTQMVIDAARSQLPVNAYTGAVDILVNPDGTAAPSLPYGTPGSLGLGTNWYHFALVARSDVASAATSPLPAPEEGWSALSLNGRTGQTVAIDEPDPTNPFAHAMGGGR